MKKTIVYIDGYNLYYGLLKGTRFKWLDLAKFAKELLPTGHDIISVKYFTACTLTYPHDNAAVERQNIYLQAVLTNPAVKVISGFFKKNKVLMPVYEESCKGCAVPQNGLIKVVRLEEKRSDVIHRAHLCAASRALSLGRARGRRRARAEEILGGRKFFCRLSRSPFPVPRSPKNWGQAPR